MNRHRPPLTRLWERVPWRPQAHLRLNRPYAAATATATKGVPRRFRRASASWPDVGHVASGLQAHGYTLAFSR